MTLTEFLTLAYDAIRAIFGIIEDVHAGTIQPVDGAAAIRELVSGLAANDAKVDGE